MFVYEKLPIFYPNVTWFVRVKEEAFVNMPGVMLMLSEFSHVEPNYVCHRLYRTPTLASWLDRRNLTDEFEFPGACGWAVNRPLLLQNWLQLQELFEQAKTTIDEENDELIWASVMSSLNIECKPYFGINDFYVASKEKECMLWYLCLVNPDKVTVHLSYYPAILGSTGDYSAMDAKFKSIKWTLLPAIINQTRYYEEMVMADLIMREKFFKRLLPLEYQDVCEKLFQKRVCTLRVSFIEN